MWLALEGFWRAQVPEVSWRLPRGNLTDVVFHGMELSALHSWKAQIRAKNLTTTISIGKILIPISNVPSDPHVTKIVLYSSQIRQPQKRNLCGEIRITFLEFERQQISIPQQNLWVACKYCLWTYLRSRPWVPEQSRLIGVAWTCFILESASNSWVAHGQQQPGALFFSSRKLTRGFAIMAT